MDKTAQKIKYGRKIETPCTAAATAGQLPTRKRMQFKHITLDFDGSVAILKLDHPEVMNAVSMDMLGGLGDALDAVDDRRSDVRCLVLTGAGRAFCAGANLQGRGKQNTGRSR